MEPWNKWMCTRHMGRFLEYDHGRSITTKKYYPEPHHPSVSLMDVQKDFGENERNKGN
jgi:arylsulfatase A-like enzyme